MRKSLVMVAVVLMFLAMATTSVFASYGIGYELYEMGKDYGVTEENRMEIDRYFTNHPATAEEEAFILEKAKEAIAVMDAAGVKDVNLLSEADLKKVQNIVKQAADKIGLELEFTATGVKIKGYDGAAVAELTFKSKADENGTKKATVSTGKSNKYVYTGSNVSMLFAAASIAAIVVGGTTVIKLRKNA